MTRRDDNINRIVKVAQALKHLNERVVFVGGAVVPLLITDPAAPDVRPTKDVDAVFESASWVKFRQLDSELHELGFTQPPSSDPICRYRLGEILVDFMPTSEEIIGFSNQWYGLAYQTAQEIKLDDNLSIKVISAPCFIATKLEAFKDRGKNDYMLSHDLEDIIKVIDGREELLREIKSSDKNLAVYLRETFNSLLQNEQFLESVSANLLSDSLSQSRVPMILQTIKTIAFGIRS